MNSLFSELKSATKTAHDQLESRLDMLAPDFNLNDYRKVLEKFLGMYRPVERAVKNSELREGYSDRFKETLLHRDLEALGLSKEEIAAIPDCDFLPDLSTHEKLLGTLYVLEGSTLGGMILTKHYGAKFSLDSLNGLSFYSSYGAKTLEMWKAWREYSEFQASDRGLDQQEIIAQANLTFSAMEKWLTCDS